MDEYSEVSLKKSKLEEEMSKNVKVVDEMELNKKLLKYIDHRVEALTKEAKKEFKENKRSLKEEMDEYDKEENEQDELNELNKRLMSTKSKDLTNNREAMIDRRKELDASLRKSGRFGGPYFTENGKRSGQV